MRTAMMALSFLLLAPNVSVAQADTVECVRFESPELASGASWRHGLMRGLDLRLDPEGAGWTIAVGPSDRPAVDYLWVVSPPLRTAPHRTIGAGYGLTAQESASMPRELRFVLDDTSYAAAASAIAAGPADETLRQLERIGRGRLSLEITRFTSQDDSLATIAVRGQACVVGRYGKAARNPAPGRRFESPLEMSSRLP